MKKMLIIILCLSVLLCFSGCGLDNSSVQDDIQNEVPAVRETSTVTATHEEPSIPATTSSAMTYEITSAKATTWVDSIGTAWVQTIIEIKNTGSVNLYLSSCSYDLEDSAGALVAVHDYVSASPEVIAPGEKSYIYNEMTLDGPVDGELTVIPHEDIVPATVEMIRYPVSDITVKDDKYMGIKILGRVENNTDSAVEFIKVVGNLFNADGQCIGQVFTYVDSIKIGEKIGFEMSGLSLPDTVSADSIASYEIYAYPNQFQF